MCNENKTQKSNIEASFMQDIFQTSTICAKHYCFSVLYKWRVLVGVFGGLIS